MFSKTFLFVVGGTNQKNLAKNSLCFKSNIFSKYISRSGAQFFTKAPCFESDRLIVFAVVDQKNKKNLTRLLNLEMPFPDYSELFASAYQKYQTKLVDYLSGDYQFVIWDKQQEKLYCANGPCSQKPFYYSQTGSGLVCSNFMPFLKLALRENLTFNKSALANLLILNASQQHSTFYEGITKLSGGYSLEYSNEKVSVKRFDKTHKTYKKIKYRNERTVFDEFRKLLKQCIALRIEGHQAVASELSGGLDSSTVSTVAASILKQQHQSLLCYSNVVEKGFQFPASGKNSIDDRQLLHDFKHCFNNVKLNYVLSQESDLTFDKIALFCYHFSDGPIRNPLNATWMYHLHALAKSVGADLLLSAGSGNIAISFPGKKPFSRLKLFIKHCLPFIYKDKTLISSFSAINPSYLKNQLKRKNETQFISFSSYTIKQLIDMYQNTGALSDAFRFGLEFYHNIEGYDPSGDQEILEFCYHLPNSIFYKNGVNRRLIRDGMRGFLPDSILDNHQVGVQHADWFYQLLKSAPFFQGLLPKFKRNPVIAELIDLSEVERLLNKLVTCDPFCSDIKEVTYQFRYKLGRALHVAHWIHLHDEPVPWPDAL